LVNFGQSSGPVEPLLMSTLASKSLTVSRPILFDYISNSTIYKKMTDSVFNAFENDICLISIIVSRIIDVISPFNIASNIILPVVQV